MLGYNVRSTGVYGLSNGYNSVDPSGTALMIADAVSDTLEQEPQYVYDRHAYRKKRSKNEIGIHSVRGGTIVGEHEVIFAGHDEVVTISHSAQSKEVFAEGAVNAAAFLASQKAGMYDMGNLLADKRIKAAFFQLCHSVSIVTVAREHKAVAVFQFRRTL